MASDGDINSEWSGSGGPAWWAADFHQDVTVEFLKISMGPNSVQDNEYPIDFTIQFSSDDVTYTTAYTKTGETLAGVGVFKTCTFSSPQVARYWKIDVTNANGNFPHLGEVQFWGQPGATIFPTPTSTPTPEGVVSARGDNSGSGEGKEKAFDKNYVTKWLDFSPSGSWIEYQYNSGVTHVFQSYSITSANDHPERDPTDFMLQGSNDGVNYVTLDSRVGITFTNRLETQHYSFSNATAYNRYKLVVTKVFDVNAANSVQLAEITLFAAP